MAEGLNDALYTYHRIDDPELGPSDSLQAEHTLEGGCRVRVSVIGIDEDGKATGDFEVRASPEGGEILKRTAAQPRGMSKRQ